MRDLNAWLESEDAVKYHRSFATEANARRALERFEEGFRLLARNQTSSLIYHRQTDGRWVVVLLNANPVAAHHFPVWG